MNQKMILAIITTIIVVSAGAVYVISEDFVNKEEYDSKITDMAGRTVEYNSNPERIALLGPSALRLYCYAGDMDKLVGIENIEYEWGRFEGRPYMLAYKDYFETLKTDIGSGGPRGVPDFEKLLDADLDVLFTTQGMEVAELDDLQNKIRTPVIKLSYGNNAPFDEDIYRSMEIIGKVSGSQEKADDVINYIKGIKNDFNTRTADIPESERATVYIGALSYGGAHGLESTTRSYNLFQELNIKNAYDEKLKELNKDVGQELHRVDWEFVQEVNPEYIVVDEGGLDLVRQNCADFPQRYDNMNAFMNGNVVVQMSFNWYASNLEMILANGYFIGKTYYPEKFADVDMKEKFDEITTNMLGKALYDDVKKEYVYSFDTWNTKSHTVTYPGVSEDYVLEKGAEGSLFRGKEISFSVTPGEGKTVTVKVNGTEIEGTDGKYSFKLMGDSVISVETSSGGV
jgi:iron complex transport system substrate-binding protein